MNKLIKFLKKFIERFVMIYGYSMLATLLFLRVFNQDIQVGTDFFMQMVIFSLVADIPPFIYYIDEEITDKLPISLDLLCTILELLFLLPLGYYFELWKGLAGFALFTLISILITLAVRFSYYTADTISAQQVMERINNLEDEYE